jgi:hypothetical protein
MCMQKTKFFHEALDWKVSCVPPLDGWPDSK